MKKIKALYLGMAITAAMAAMTSCQADMEVPALEEPKATMVPNTTLADFKTAFADQTVLCPMKDAATETPYIIHGRVISSDATGNIYKSIVIQDETAALAISVNQGSTYAQYRIGQEVVINATGIYIGYYNGLQQLGWYDLYDGAPSLTFMPWDIFRGHSEMNGFPNPNVQYIAQGDARPADNPYCIIADLTQLPSTGEDFRNMQSQLVEFRNVYFVDGGKEPYAPYQESVNRTIKGVNGGEIICRTSGYSNFYNDIIPEGVGAVRGILSYYGDAWQLLLRGKGDVLITEKGQKDDPYTVAEAMEVENQGASGWVTAYIVGSVKAGVNTVTSNSDVIFGTDAEMDNNILIAADKDCKDWTQCLAVELPQGSAFRASVNLVDNPGVLGKEILVNGNLTSFLGMPGITGNGGTAADVEVSGVTIAGGDTPVGPAGGDGSQTSPYNVTQVNAMEVANNVNLYTGVWVSGYIVGYVDTGIKTYAADESAKFGTGTVVTNLLLADSPTVTDWNQCISVNLPSGSAARTALNLADNPGNLGKLLTIKGNITKYVGIPGVKEPSEWTLGEGGGETPTPPTPSDETQIFSGLSADANGWDLNVGTIPTGLDYVWAWDSSYKYLKATAYKGGVYAADVTAASPVIDLTGVTDATVSYETVFNNYKENNVMINLSAFNGYAYIMVREEGAASWSVLSEIKAQGLAWNPWYTVENSLKNYAGKKIQIGFRYVSTATVAGTWEVKNLTVKGKK